MRWARTTRSAIILAAVLFAGPKSRAADPPKFDVERLPPPTRAEPVPAPVEVPCGPLVQPAMTIPKVTPAFRATPLPAERGLPINLATALRLSEARPLLINAAQASVQAAMAQFERARVLWLPNLNVGASYLRHDGGVQGSSGQFFNNGRNQFLAGGGPYLILETTDAIFTPLSARQVLRSRRFDLQAARNDALLTVTDAYFDVQQARGQLAGAEDAAAKAQALSQRVEALAVGLVSPIEVNRARTLLAALRESVATARGQWGTASAELTRSLRLAPTAYVLPLEPPDLQVSLIAPTSNLDQLVTVGLTNRPELAAQQALVQAALARIRQERMRPLVPSVVLTGAAVPTAPGGFLMGGVFGSSTDGQSQPIVGRNDLNVQLFWGLNNLGFGNRALTRERVAEQRQQLIELFRTQDAVAADVAKAYAQLEAAAQKIPAAELGVREAQISYAGNLEGLSQTTRFGDLLVLVNRPQEVVAALQQLATAYENYFAAINEYNRAQFRLFRALGFPPALLSRAAALGEAQPIDGIRPPGMAPVCPTPYVQ